MKRILVTMLIVFGLGTMAAAQNKQYKSPQDFINKEMKTDPMFQNAIIGILAVDDNGKVVAEWNSNMPMLTASTMKTISTGVGLAYLGKDFRYSTKIAYTGEIKEGVLEGNLHIIGGGDPTLGSKDTVAFAIDSIFGVWTAAIKSLGINRINGNIVVDDTYFVREQMPDSWSWGNFGASYGSTASGLSFYENVQDFKLYPGKSVGDAATIEVVYPQVPGLEVVNEVTTGPARAGTEAATMFRTSLVLHYIQVPFRLTEKRLPLTTPTAFLI